MKKLIFILALLLPMMGFPQRSTDYDNWIYEGDKSITEYRIPDGVRVIGDEAFMNCEDLTSITIPESVTSIGASAFELCTSLKNVFIPKNVKEIKSCAFSSCYSLQGFEVDEDNPYFTTIDGVLFSHDKTKLVCCPNKNEYSIPNGTKIIGLYAFQGCKDMTSVTIPNSVEIIEEGAFSWCNGLTSITIPKSVKEIGSAAFWKSVNLKTVNLPEGITGIKSSLFKRCKNLETIRIPNSVKRIDDYAFLECESLKYIIIPDGVESIGKSAFLLCNNLSSITIPASVKIISDFAFQQCGNLKNVTIENGVENIGKYAFSMCDRLTSISIPNSVKEIETAAFWKSENLKTVNLPDGIEKIKICTFAECKKLKTITIPKSVTSIGCRAFEECTALKKISIPESVVEIDELAFVGDKNLKTVELHNGLKKLGDYVFYKCNNISSITLPGSLIEVGNNIFQHKLLILSDTSVMSQLIKNKCLCDVYCNIDQYDSMQNCIIEMCDLLSSNELQLIYYLPFYRDITNYYSLIGDFEKVKYYCEEAKSKKYVDIDSMTVDCFGTQYHHIPFLDLQHVDVCINLHEYDIAKKKLSMFATNFCGSTKKEISNPVEDLINSLEITINSLYYHTPNEITDPIFKILRKDEDLGAYYYYLIMKLYLKLNDRDKLEILSDLNVFADVISSTKSIYLVNVFVQWTKSKEFVLGEVLSTNLFEALKQDVIKGIKKVGMSYSGFHEVFTTIANMHYYRKEYDSAFVYNQNSFTYELARLKENFSFMNTYQRQNYWQEHKTSFDNIVNLCTKLPNNKEAVEMAYNSLLTTKGLILAGEQTMNDIILESRDVNLNNKFIALKSYRIKIDETTNSKTRDSLRTIAERLETDLMKKSSQFADIISYMNVDWQKVQKTLRDKDLAIEFFFNDNDSLFALVLKKDFETPKLVPLSGFNKDFSFYSTTELYEALWKPLEQYMSENGSTYFSPSGALYNIAIEYAPIDSTHTISDKYKIYRISSTRNLALSKPKPTTNKKAATYGGIQYNFGPGNWADRKDKEYDSYVSDLVAFRDVPDLENTTLRTGVQNLIGTKIEAQQITDILRNNGYQVSENNDIYATEESFKKLSGSGLTLLHIATHGFYQPKDTVVNNSYEKEDISLSQSGLLFAGANSAIDPQKRKEIPEGFDDGILTAKEISRMDLKGLDLVVLSACQTGLGEVTSEGVFGLQRGFKKAGANTIVMSLWKVDDNATKDLMTEFYKNLVSGKSKRDAFLAAQAMLRSKYKDPKKWAAFVMVDGVE